MDFDYNPNEDNHRDVIAEEGIFDTLSRVRPSWKYDILAILCGLALAASVIYGWETCVV